MMDQRISDRKAVSLPAVLGCDRFGLLRGQIVDLSPGGLYVRAETSIVPIGAEVTVSFQSGEAARGTCLSGRGRIAHQSLQGFGIEFVEFDSVGLAALDRLLIDMPPVPSRAVPVLRML